MPSVYCHPIVVPDLAIDDLNHANNAAYVGWMQEAAKAHSAANGWPSERYLRDAAGWVVKAHSIEYLAPAYAGDRITIRTWVSKISRVVSWRRFEFVRAEDDGLLVRAETKWAYVDFGSLRPRPIPQAFRQDFDVLDDEQARRLFE
jgi:acyl-CoA thioester hydrolase